VKLAIIDEPFSFAKLSCDCFLAAATHPYKIRLGAAFPTTSRPRTTQRQKFKNSRFKLEPS
jgi:hypothetical protein